MMTMKKSRVSTGDITEELVDSFFEAEVEMERKICRDVVCTSHKDEEGKHTSAMCLTSQFTLSWRILPKNALPFDAVTDKN